MAPGNVEIWHREIVSFVGGTLLQVMHKMQTFDCHTLTRVHTVRVSNGVYTLTRMHTVDVWTYVYAHACACCRWLNGVYTTRVCVLLNDVYIYTLTRMHTVEG